MIEHKPEKLLRAEALKIGQPQRVASTRGNLVLCRTPDGVYALDDLCTHEDVSLSLGALCEHRLRCPLHGSEFDVRTGHVLSEPAELDLRTHSVIEQGDWIVLSSESV